MSWSAYYWVWRLEEPVYIGMPPAKSLNRCRPYLPARAMHGAITAELARIGFDENPRSLSEPDYGKFGKEIGTLCRFTYLYPATEKTEDQFMTWLPKYMVPQDDGKHRDTQITGLQWYQDGDADVRPQSDRDFRRCLMDTRASTAIGPENDAALDGSLHETEYINTRWRPFDRNTVSSQVYFAGYVFLKNNAFLQKLQTVETLWVGGDNRYGLGKIQRILWKAIDPSAACIFRAPVNLNACEPIVITDRVLAHTYSDLPMQGMKELLGGWNITGPWKQDEEYVAWGPGSSAVSKQGGKIVPPMWSIDTYGFWRNDNTSIDGV